MPRKRNSNTSEYYEVFPTRLRMIMEEKACTQQQLADVLGRSRQAIGYYLDGSSSPDWKCLSMIAEFFKVSTDWLLGLTSVKTPESNIREICDATGLTESTFEALESLNRNHKATVLLLNYLLQDGFLIDALTAYYSASFADESTSNKYDLLQNDSITIEKRIFTADLYDALQPDRDKFHSETMKSFENSKTMIYEFILRSALNMNPDFIKSFFRSKRDAEELFKQFHIGEGRRNG